MMLLMVLMVLGHGTMAQTKKNKKSAAQLCPGHLATAVHFSNDVKGDYIMLDGARYTICDPTLCCKITLLNRNDQTNRQKGEKVSIKMYQIL